MQGSLTDEVSEIADRLTVAAQSWARPDAMDHRDPTTEIELLFDAMNELNRRRVRIAELEAALRDCTAFVAVHVDRWARDNGGQMHETHRELLDRIGRLTGRDDLVQRLEAKQ